MIGVGIVIRDSEGKFMAGKTHQMQDVSDPHRAKLIAGGEGLLFTWELGFRRVFLEGDARAVYASIKGDDEDLSHNGSILVIFFCWLLSFLSLIVVVCQDSRKCNKVVLFSA